MKDNDEIKQRVADSPKAVQAKAIAVGVNILSDVSDVKLTEFKSYLVDTIKSYDDKINFKVAKWGFSNLHDWLDELDKCYEVSQIDTAYAGKSRSKLVTNDYHDAMVAVMNRMKKVFKGQHRKFNAVAPKTENQECALLARELVRYNMLIGQIDKKSRAAYYDLANYGFTIIHNPLVIREFFFDEINDLYIDKKTGKPIFIGGEPVRDAEGWKNVVKYAVYTDFIEVDPRDIKFDPNIKDIKRQKAIFRKIELNVAELLNASDEESYEGVEQFIDEKDMQGYWEESPTEQEAEQQNKKPKILTEAYVYYPSLTDNSGELKKYVAVMGNEDRLLLLKECKYSTFPFINVQFEETKEFPFCGMGPGQVIYPVYLGLNTRLQQGFDKRTNEILPGGLYDTLLGSVSGLGPNIWKGVPGLATLPGKPVVTNNDLMGRTSQMDQIDLAYLQTKIQSVVPNLLSGRPTGTMADSTFRGMDMLQSHAQGMIDTNLIDVEEGLYGAWSQDCYENYKAFFRAVADTEEEVKIILTDLLGADKLTYQNAQGEIEEIDFPNALPPVDFVFTSAQTMAENMEKMDKLSVLSSIIKDWGTVVPEYVQSELDKLSFSNIIKKVVGYLDMGDMDEFFPPTDINKELSQLKSVNAGLQSEIMTSKTLLRNLNLEILNLLKQSGAENNDVVKATTQRIALALAKFMEDQYEHQQDMAKDNKLK